MTAARCWDVYACPGECIGRSGLWNVAPRGMTCPRCGGKVEPVRVTADAARVAAEVEVERLRSENDWLHRQIGAVGAGATR